MTNRQRTPIEGIARVANTAQLDSILALLRRLQVTADADSGNVTFTLGDKEGATKFRILDSAEVEQFTLDSDGNLVVETVAAGGPDWILGEFVETASTFVTPTGDYTVLATDETIEYASGSYTVTLPDGEDVPGKVYNIKNSGNGIITINTTNSRTIDGNASGVIKLVQYDNLTVQSNGRNYIIL